MGLDLLLLCLGLSFLIVGSHLLVSSLKTLSLYFKLKPLFLSIVVLGFASSSPEWFVTITAGFKDLSDAALGNILGSNVINILLVLSLAGLFYKFSSDRQIIRFDMPVLIVGSLILGLFSVNQRIDWWEALLLLGVFSAYLVLLFQKRKNEDVSLKGDVLDRKFSVFKALGILVFGFATLFVGSSLAVDSSLDIVESLSLSERFAGVFILSISTSLPELATSLQAVFKKEGEMALGNIVGSNIFNTLFVLGSAGLLSSLQFSKELYYDYFFVVLVTLLLWFALLFFKNIAKVVFTFFIAVYFLYIVFVSGALN